jgi:DNA-binding FrmR family transcriptional regulator
MGGMPIRSVVAFFVVACIALMADSGLALYTIGGYATGMSHTIRNKSKLVKRVARIRGQLDAVVRALEEEVECGEVLRVIASARGAMDGLMAEVLEDHIRAHAFRGAKPNSNDARAADELVDVMRSYLK